MKVKRVYNNNIIAASSNNREVILTGNGIGFKMKVDDKVIQHKIDKIYVLESPNRTNFNNLFNKIPIQYFNLSQIIVHKICSTLNIKVKPQWIATLTCMIWLDTKSTSSNTYPLYSLQEMQVFFPKVYDLGLWATNLIHQHCKLQSTTSLSYSLAFFILQTIYPNDLMIVIHTFIQELQRIIENTLSISHARKDVHYIRFLTHCKFLAFQVLQNTHSPDDDNIITMSTLDKVPTSVLSSIQIMSQFIQLKYLYTLNQNEKLALLLHLNKLTSSNKSSTN